jgi:ketopantoate reductase
MIVDEMAAESIPSMLVDLRSGRRLEIEHLSGTVVRLGHQLDIDVPFHETAYAALKHYANGRTMTAATVIDDLPPGRKA